MPSTCVITPPPRALLYMPMSPSVLRTEVGRQSHCFSSDSQLFGAPQKTNTRVKAQTYGRDWVPIFTCFFGRADVDKGSLERRWAPGSSGSCPASTAIFGGQTHARLKQNTFRVIHKAVHISFRQTPSYVMRSGAP